MRYLNRAFRWFVERPEYSLPLVGMDALKRKLTPFPGKRPDSQFNLKAIKLADVAIPRNCMIPPPPATQEETSAFLTLEFQLLNLPMAYVPELRDLAEAVEATGAYTLEEAPKSSSDAMTIVPGSKHFKNES